MRALRLLLLAAAAAFLPAGLSAGEEAKGPAPVHAVSPDGQRRASADPDGTVRLSEIATGRLLLSLRLGQQVAGLSFSADGKRLTAKGAGGAERAWDVPMELLWQDLLGDEAARAVRSLAVDPGTVPFLAARLHPAAGDDGRIAALIVSLDDDRYATREEATQALEALGAAAEPALRKVLAGTESLEVRTRAEALLAALGKPRPMPTGEALRTLRAIQLLALIGSPEARRLLETLAAGAPGAPETRDADAALRRLEARDARK